MAKRVKINIKGRIVLLKIGRLELCYWKDIDKQISVYGRPDTSKIRKIYQNEKNEKSNY